MMGPNENDFYSHIRTSSRNGGCVAFVSVVTLVTVSQLRSYFCPAVTGLITVGMSEKGNTQIRRRPLQKRDSIAQVRQLERPKHRRKSKHLLSQFATTLSGDQLKELKSLFALLDKGNSCIIARAARIHNFLCRRRRSVERF
jgi:hypothetical protein